MLKIEETEGLSAASSPRSGWVQVTKLLAFKLKIGAGVKGADRRADQENADRAVDKEKAFVNQAAIDVPRFFAELVADRLEDEGEEDQDPHPVGAAEGGGIEFGKGGKQRPAEENQGGEGHLPFAAQGIDDQVLFGLGFGHLPQQALPALDKGQKQKQAADHGTEQPPEMLQGCIIKMFYHFNFPPVRC